MENGALGFDFHPKFNEAGTAEKPFLYLYYTSYLQDSQTNYLSRFDLSLSNASARTGSELQLITQNRNNGGYHNAGAVEFGPDGFLYLSVGEASADDCHQRIDCSLVGGVLRLDVDETGGDVSHPPPRQPKDGVSANYYIPNDNPYVGEADALEEFWAHGMRNPFRISFDEQTGALWSGEVGSTVWEEVNLIVKGGNYQFPYREGNVDTEILRPETITGEQQAPVYAYEHTALLRAVIGGSVYRGTDFPELQGQYLFGDNYSGEIFSLPATGEQVDQVERIARSPLVAQAGITSLVNAPNGEILVTAMGGANSPTGLVFRLVGDDEEFSSEAIALANNTNALVSSDEAKSLFNTNCARCHGSEGAADGPDSQKLGAWVPNFQTPEFQKWRSDEEILVAIQKGGTGVGQSPAMPPWENILSEAEIIALRDYVRSFKP
jgi:glucose/arabinose dehydrogenase